MASLFHVDAEQNMATLTQSLRASCMIPSTIARSVIIAIFISL